MFRKLHQFKKDKKTGTQTRSGKKESGLSVKTLNPPDNGIQFVTKEVKKEKKKIAKALVSNRKGAPKKIKNTRLTNKSHQNISELHAVIKQDEHDEHLTILAAKHIKEALKQFDSAGHAEHNTKILEDIVYWMHTNGLQHTCTYAFAKAMEKEAHNASDA